MYAEIEQERTTVLSASVPPSLVEAFKACARAHDRTLSAELRVAMRAHLAEPSSARRARS
jgi:hypothetical protein